MEPTKNHLLQRRAGLIDEAKAMFAAAEKAGRPLTSAEQARDAEIEQEIAAIDPQIAKVEARLAREREQTLELGGGRQARPGAGAKYASLFGADSLSNGGFETFGEFVAPIHGGLADPRLMATMTGAVPSEGGFLVPTEYSAALLDGALEGEIIRPRATVWPMTSNTRKVAGISHTDASGGSIFGFSGGWITEAGAITAETANVRAIELKARKLALLAPVSNELASDGMDFEAQVMNAMRKAVGWHLDQAFLSGDGAGSPLGVLNAANGCLITVTKTLGQTAATVSYRNIVTMYGRLHPASVKNAVWVCSTSVVPALLELSVAIGASGVLVPVLNDASGQWRMLGLPVIFTEKLPSVGTVGDVLLADFSQFVIGLRREIVLDKSLHVGFSSDLTYYRTVVRVAGQPMWNAPYTPKNGPTTSPFVVLETRS